LYEAYMAHMASAHPAVSPLGRRAFHALAREAVGAPRHTERGDVYVGVNLPVPRDRAA
jgi:hypothetical protein